MKMKKYLPLSLFVFLTSTGLNPSYAAQAATTALQWIGTNPYTTTTGILTAKALWNTSLEYYGDTEDWLDQRELIAKRASEDINTKRLLQKIQPLAEEHGFKKIFILTATQEEEDAQGTPQFGLDRYGDELFIVIPHELATGIRNETDKAWKEKLIHELGHAVKHHPTYKRLLAPTVGSPTFRSHVALGVALATGVTAFSPALSVISSLAPHANPLYLTAAAGSVSSAVTGSTYPLAKKSLDRGCTNALNALSRTFERSADAYVAVTATQKNNPDMLERYADSLEDYIDKNRVEKGITHPPLKERVATARAAAEGLRKRLNAHTRKTHVD